MARRPERLHIVIRHLEFLAGSRERPELGVFAQTHAGRPPVPWGQIAPSEPLLVKLADGPIVARAQVEGLRIFEGCDAETLRRATLGYGLHALEAYWSQLPPRFFGMVVFITHENWLEETYTPRIRSRGASWIVAEGTERAVWELAGADAAESLTSTSRQRQTIPARLRFFVLRRDGFACTYCGRQAVRDGVILHIDHIVPFAAGGQTIIENLRTACSVCNLGKGREPLGSASA
jgi:hypothetical protein